MNICVFCSSSNRTPQPFIDAAIALGEGLARAGHTLVYGGGKVGLMGQVATAAHAGGGKVIGIIPKSLAEREVAYTGADELIITSDMLSRKAILMERSDMFLALPGGLGTLDEILEVLTHFQLGYHQKPTLLINVDGFYNDFHQYLNRLTQLGLLHTALSQLYQLVDDVPACLARIS